MDIGGIFRNLFRTPQQGNSGSDGVGTVPTTPPDLDIYDDTDLALRSRPRSTAGREDILRLPSFRDLDERKEDNDGDGKSGCEGRGRQVQPFNPGMSFVFGEMFSVVREMFGEMDRSMREMDEFFNSATREMDAFFNDEDTFPRPRSLYPNAPTPNPDSVPGLGQEGSESGNIRQKVLKREDVPRPPKHERLDEDLDDFYKYGKPDLGAIVIPPPPPEDGSMEEAWKSREPSRGFTYHFHQQRQYQSSPGGTIVEKKTIRDTNEGRSITTYKKNEKGEVEEEKQFIPRGTNGPTSTSTPEEPVKMLPWNIFSLFPPRPRM